MKIRVPAAILVLSTTLFAPQFAAAGVYMCEDPVTGKKTFTDRACASTKGPGKKVRVTPNNFGAGRSYKENGTWSSDKDTSVAGRNNFVQRSVDLDATSGQRILPDEDS